MTDRYSSPHITTEEFTSPLNYQKHPLNLSSKCKIDENRIKTCNYF